MFSYALILANVLGGIIIDVDNKNRIDKMIRAGSVIGLKANFHWEQKHRGMAAPRVRSILCPASIHTGIITAITGYMRKQHK